MTTFARTLAAPALAVGIALGGVAATAAVTSPVANAAPSYCAKPSSELTAAQRAICGQTTTAPTTSTTAPSTTAPSPALTPDNGADHVLAIRSASRWTVAGVLSALVLFGSHIVLGFRRDAELNARTAEKKEEDHDEHA
ncbi:hypothetical protein ABQE48_13090 [Mycolicibacterium thermoresistibile]